MDRGPELKTARLLMRRWAPSDAAPFAALNADPSVMEHFDRPLTRDESDRFIARIEKTFEERGFGLWAVEVAAGPPFIGFVGLWPAEFEAHFTPAIEVGWRLAREAWGHGYATEAAKAAVGFGFDELELDEIVSMTTHANVRSQRVMQRIGMVRDADDDFEHPSFPAGHPVRPHVLYRLPRERWTAPG